jgi:hypothetical protein
VLDAEQPGPVHRTTNAERRTQNVERISERRPTSLKSLARDRDKVEILHRVSGVTPDSVARWGRMSVHQMICHLSDGFLMATGDKAVSRIDRVPTGTIIKWMALYLPLRWPPGTVTRPEIDQEMGGTRPGDFAADLARLVALIELTAKMKGVAWQRHPIFGRMSESEWLRWGYLHVDHHLRQFGA